MRVELVTYIKKNLKKGYTMDSLRFALISQGYPRGVIEQSIEKANKELAKEVPAIKEKPQIIHEIIDESDKSMVVKKPFWKRIFGL